MLKRIMVALAGLFLMLGLAAAPASGTQSQLDMFSDVDGFGDHEFVFTVPSECSTAPLTEVKSARNTTSTIAEFYQTSDCSGSPLRIADTNGQLVDIVDAQGNGATHYKAAG